MANFAGTRTSDNKGLLLLLNSGLGGLLLNRLRGGEGDAENS